MKVSLERAWTVLMNEKRLRLVVLVSGSGTNLQSLIDKSHSGELAADIVAVLSDNKDAYGLERARNADIPTHVVAYRRLSEEDRKRVEAAVDIDRLLARQQILKSPDPTRRREQLLRLVRAESELIERIDSHRPDLICLAGYMRLLSPHFIDHYHRDGQPRIMNIHPALLPAFPGAHGYEDTFAYGCKWGGVTVHFVDQGEDTGPIIAQGIYPIWPDDDIDSIRRRGLNLEYKVYAQCVNWMAADQLRMDTSPSGRTIVTISDPDYRKIIGGWTRIGE